MLYDFILRDIVRIFTNSTLHQLRTYSRISLFYCGSVQVDLPIFPGLLHWHWGNCPIANEAALTNMTNYIITLFPIHHIAVSHELRAIDITMYKTKQGERGVCIFHWLWYSIMRLSSSGHYTTLQCNCMAGPYVISNCGCYQMRGWETDR